MADQAWDVLAGLLQEEDPAGPALPASAHFRAAAAQLGALRRRHAADPPDPYTVGRELEGYLSQWGPGREALALFVLSAPASGPPADPDLTCRASDRQRQLLRLYPHDPDALAAAAERALRLGDFDAALGHTAAGLRLDPSHFRLAFERLEAAAARGLDAEAEALSAALRSGRLAVPEGIDARALPWLPRLRGEVRGGRLADAVGTAGEWVAAGASPAYVARQLRRDPDLRPAAGRLISSVPRLAAVPAGVRGEVLGILRTHLSDDGGRAHVGYVPEAKWRAAAEFVRPRDGEEILYLCDWSVLGAGGDGLAVTDRRVAWRGFWGGAVRLPLSRIEPDRVTLKGAVLTVNGHSIDVRDESLARSLWAALWEIAATARGGAKGRP